MHRRHSTADLAHLRVHLWHIQKHVLCLLWYFISQGSFKNILQQQGKTGERAGKRKEKNIVTVLNAKNVVSNEVNTNRNNMRGKLAGCLMLLFNDLLVLIYKISLQLKYDYNLEHS